MIYKPYTQMSIAIVICLLSVLTGGCSREQPTSADGATEDSDESNGAVSVRQAGTPNTERSTNGGSHNAASIAVRVLPTDSFNAIIRQAASDKASWTGDPAQIALRFWQEHARDPYADSSTRGEPQLSRLPITAEAAAFVGFRVTDEADSDGDDAIAREWTDLSLRRDARTGLWQIEEASTSAECLRGVAGALCL